MIELHEKLVGHRRIDFDRKKLRKAVREGAKLVRREGRRLAGKKAGGGKAYRVWGDMLHKGSAPGEAPTKVTGTLQRSIFYRTLDDNGLSMSVGPAARRVFYARFLAAGTQKMAARPFMGEALERTESPVRDFLRAGLEESLTPR
ncbi:HK97-gp10 family putative phage morphogenesis protein [Azospirillum sp. SYSU D00513]|uniref:HK97-gp10 family putative phage morphogenesis protein n=1 Tax=Azospirillum sp. SYSU D00513 TaxID=2812561 RepID=UPI001A963AED|nr:HK97-gp10 family putative phage morphogenesis protein [Azospirillum sp. SYSU D00513]